MTMAHGDMWDDLDVSELSLDVNGQTLAVTRFGEGPALVIVHGIGSRAGTWMPIARELATHYDVIAYDQRGHGASSHPEAGYLLPDYAADLGELIDRIGLERPLIMGHSLGGMVTLEWARAHPDRAAALVIEDSPMRHGGPAYGERFDAWTAQLSMPLADLKARYRADNPQWSDVDIDRRARGFLMTAPAVFEELNADMMPQGGISVVPTYADILSPALLVYGDVETGGLVPGFDALAFGETVPNAELAHISGGSHSLHRDSPEAFLAAVEPFLARFAPDASQSLKATS